MFDPTAYTTIIRDFRKKVDEANGTLTRSKAPDYESYLQRHMALKVWTDALRHIEELYQQHKEYDEDD